MSQRYCWWRMSGHLIPHYYFCWSVMCLLCVFLLLGRRSICTISSRRLLYESLLIAIHPISSTTGSSTTTSALALIALFGFTSSFKHNVCKDLYFLSPFVTNGTTWQSCCRYHWLQIKWWRVQRERSPSLWLTCELASTEPQCITKLAEN